jgi:hypothetical protein
LHESLGFAEFAIRGLPPDVVCRIGGDRATVVAFGVKAASAKLLSPFAPGEDLRFLLFRTRTKQQRKGPVQLDLFTPYQEGYEFKVTVTNKALGVAALAEYHGGRGSQQGVFGELKTQCQMDYIRVRTRAGNETYLLASLFAFNLIRELQMQLAPPARTTNRKRTALWTFEQVTTVRRTILPRAGRLSRPAGKLILTFCAGKQLKERLLKIYHTLAA